jgi:hypothetical protein
MATKKTANKKTTAKAKPKAKAQVKAKQKAKQRPKAKARTKAAAAAPKAKALPKKTPGSALYKLSNTKRPPNTPLIPQQVITEVTLALEQVKVKLDAYAAHLRALDRKRLNNIGVKREGFAQRAFRLAMDNPEFLPNYLERTRYIEDYDYYVILQSAVDADRQVHELLRNIDTECHDVFYTDGLDYYAAVKEAAKRRVDAAESVYEDLAPFFKHKKSTDAPETKKQQMRDIKGYMNGKKEGIAVIENIKPKMEGGVHKVIDEQFRDNTRFKQTEQGEIDE